MSAGWRLNELPLRQSDAIIKTSEVVQEIIQLRDGGALGFALNLTPRLRAAQGRAEEGPQVLPDELLDGHVDQVG